jgi:hypothetical protein
MDFLRIRNWEKWQSYRRDRGQPPWIKVHRRLVHDSNWVTLSDAQRGHVLALWILAADRNGLIPACPLTLQKLCRLDDPPDIKLLIEKEFLDANVTSRRRQHVHPEAEAEAEAEAERRINGKSKHYKFESGVIRLNKKNYDQWVKAYSYLDVPAELLGLTEWAATLEPNRWFVAVSAVLAKRNREQKTKIETAKKSPMIWKSGKEGVL